MAMETNTASMPTGIRPIERPQGPQTTGVQRRGGVTTSPFAPRTDVSLQNSVADVASLLSKIASSKEETMDKLSPQLQKLVDNIMKQSFSLESTLAEGLGTTLESQRFAIDQMFTLSRVLYQMGMFSEQGKTAALNDQMQALLANFKDLMTAGEGKEMEPTMLHKLAFEVLDGKQADELSQMMQFLLMGQGTGAGMAAAPQAEGTDTFGFLKQLMDYFMPRPGAESSVPGQMAEGKTAQGGQAGAEAGTGTGEAPRAADGKPGTEPQPPSSGRPEDGQGIARDGAGQKPGAATQGTAAGQPAGSGVPEKAVEQPQQNAVRENPSGGQAAPQEAAPNQGGAEAAKQMPQTPQGPTGQPAAEGQGAPRATESSTETSYTWQNEAAEEQTETSRSTEFNPQDPFAELMRKGLERMRGRLQQPPPQAQQNEQGEPASTAQMLSGRMAQQPTVQNTPRTMEAMKDLASLLLKNMELTPEDEKLLTDFVNNKQTMMTEKEAKELQMLLRLCQQNVPASVQHSAQQKGMEDMPRLWAFMELCDLANIRERDSKSLKRASKSLSDFASMMKNSMLPENGRTAEGHRSMSFMTPLYMSEDMQKPYPAYIHIYDEEKKDENGGSPKKETWVRVCLLTENIGAVDVSFRMYDESSLDVRIYFSERENIEDFRSYMEEFSASFDDKPLTLMSVKVGVAGAKT